MGRAVLRFLRFALCLLLVTVPVQAQPTSGQTGERVYRQVAESVYLLEILNSQGDTVGSATGFLVGQDMILTNAHVTNKGDIAVRLGAIRVPCVLQRQDQLNDLALCKMTAQSTSKPIPLAATDPTPGSTVYALGNPSGLERTISQGLFTALRETEGRRLAQVSAPISPGSSGGPVLNADGDLVGVAVGTLQSGQNLNFAVPISIVRTFLSGEPAPSAPGDSLVVLRRLVKQLDEAEFSTEENSEWARLTEEAKRVFASIIRAANNVPDIAAAQAVVANQWWPDARVEAARKIVKIARPPTRQQYADLADALYMLAEGEEAPELAEAKKAVAEAIRLGGGPRVDDLILLGRIYNQEGRREDAYASYKQANSLLKPGQTSPEGLNFALFRSALALGRDTEASSWAEKARATDNLRTFELNELGGFYWRQKRWAEAGKAYADAHKQAPKVLGYACWAGASYYVANQVDDCLAMARKCIEIGAISKGNNDSLLAAAHQQIADILIDRGVYETAEEHAKQAIALNPADAFNYHNLARALNRTNRPSEALAAAKNAVRTSDGRYAEMHFELGSAYFALKQFAESAQAFEKAAQIDLKDPVSAYNAGASYYNLRFWPNALNWYREAARRDPSYQREQIAKVIAELVKR